jgi:hypothetical protein
MISGAAHSGTGETPTGACWRKFGTRSWRARGKRRAFEDQNLQFSRFLLVVAVKFFDNWSLI